MSRKSKFSYEAKLKAVKQYISGEASPASIAKVLGAGRTTLRQWVYAFKDQGAEALRPHKYNGLRIWLVDQFRHVNLGWLVILFRLCCGKFLI